MANLQHDIRFTHLASGARLAWAASGRGPPLLRAAHWMTHVEHDLRSAIWRPWLERLGRGLRVLRYDERGCGLSGPDSTPLTLDTAVEELAAVLDASGLPTVALLGISGGAAPAIALAARQPQRISHLVLLGSYAAGPAAREPSADQQAYLDATAKLIELGWGLANSPVQQLFSASLVPAGTPEQVRAMNEQQRVSCDGARAAALYRARIALDVRSLLGQVRCPTLVLHSAHDGAVALQAGLDVAAGISGARFESLPSHNHIPLAGEPAFERLCEAITDFVRTPVAASANSSSSGWAFTPRERDLLGLVAQGRDNLQIGASLGLADKTVRNALSRLYSRLGVEGRPQAVVKARELGFG